MNSRLRIRTVALAVLAAATTWSKVATAASVVCGLPAAGSSNLPRPAGTPGNLKSLHWAGFTAAATYTFDGTNQSQVANYAALQALGVHYTFFLIGNKIATNTAAWQRAVSDGHEIGNGTQTSNSVTLADVQQGDQTINSTLGVSVYTMASPNGNIAYEPFAQQLYFLD